MFTQSPNMVPGKLDEEFSRPVESIMKCEDFKSNFARRLSNRYISRSSSVSNTRQDEIKLFSSDANRQAPDNAPERIEPCSQLSKMHNTEQNSAEVRPPGKVILMNSDIRRTEVTALNMEVETLRWQLAQTEANRQMHIGLLKQIVTFLNRVKIHLECQKNMSESQKEITTTEILSSSFNLIDFPRSRSVLHVNKTHEGTLSSTRKFNSKKISKSICNVNNDCRGAAIENWNQSKLSLASEVETSQKMTEEISRLITLANTVLSTKLPDLACSCNDTNGVALTDSLVKVQESNSQNEDGSLCILEESSNAFLMNKICDSEDVYAEAYVITNKFIESKKRALNNFSVSPSPLTCGLENDFCDAKLDEKEPMSVKPIMESTISKETKLIDRKNTYNHISSYMEDESGFSSMSSFQEIGIPIINIIPPSPNKEMRCDENVPTILQDGSLDLDKEAMKVFWV